MPSPMIFFRPILTLLLLAPFFVLSQTDFRSLRFGMSPSQVKGLTLEIEDGPTSLYIMNQELMLENEILSDAMLTFTGGKLSAIRTNCSVKNNDTLIRLLEKQFGKLRRSDPRKNHWQNSQVKVTLDRLKNNDVVIIIDKA